MASRVLSSIGSSQHCASLSFKTGEALNWIVFPAGSVINSPVLGFMSFRAFVILTLNVPNDGTGNFPVVAS